MMMRVDRWFAAVMIISALGYALLLPVVMRRLDPLTGDEPFYVMTAISLLHDHDLDESNNYAHRDYDAFYPPDPLPPNWQGWPGFPRDLPPHPATSSLPGLHTKHGIGLSLLIALPYAVAGRAGAALTVSLFAVLLVGQMYLLARESGANRQLSAAVSLGLGLVMPIAPYALLIFPEVPAALLLIYAIRRLSDTPPELWRMAATGCAIGFLPWLHQRFAPTAAVLGLVLLARWWSVRPLWRVAAAVGPVVAGGVSLLIYNQWLYGQPLQRTEDHAGFNHLSGAINGLFGLVIDAQWGLFVAAPIFIIAIAATPWWIDAAPKRAAIAGAAVAPYVALIAAYKVWWGEWGPPARYLVPIVPLAAGPLAAWLARVPSVWRALALVCWLPGLVLTEIGFGNPQRFYHQPDGINNLVRILGDSLHMNLAGRLVAFQPYAVAPRNERDAAAYFTLALIVIGYLVVRVAPLLIEERAHERRTPRVMSRR